MTRPINLHAHIQNLRAQLVERVHDDRQQTRRDAACIVVFVLAALYYALNLFSYLSALSKPFPLLLGFGGSWVFAVLQELRHRFGRSALVRATAVTVLFMLAVPMAHIIRDGYADLVFSITHYPDVMQVIGTDYYEMAKNKAVGYGGCFAAALMIGRWTLHNRLERILVWLLIKPEHRLTVCQHCNQQIYN